MLAARLRPAAEAGLLVLFPSDLWHAAIPFDATGDSLTVAFDPFAADIPQPRRRYVTG